MHNSLRFILWFSFVTTYKKDWIICVWIGISTSEQNIIRNESIKYEQYTVLDKNKDCEKEYYYHKL